MRRDGRLIAMAGERTKARRGAESGFSAVWRTVARWVVPSEWVAKLGPGMDPDGVTGTVPAGGPGDSAGSGELGPGMDPNG